MKLAYLSHNFTLKRIKRCKDEEGKRILALNYFLHDAEIVNEQMKLTLQHIEMLEARIEELEDELHDRTSETDHI